MTKSPLFMHFAVVLFASLLFSCSSDPEPLPPPESSSSSLAASSSSSTPNKSSSGSSSSGVGSGSSSSGFNGSSSSSRQSGVDYGPSVVHGGETYETVVIGTQTWFKRNLNYGPGTGNSSCYDNSSANCTKYGRLYDWATAMSLPSKCNSTLSTIDADCRISTPNHKGICPTGWHIPSNKDWDKLMRYVDGNTGTSSPYDSETAGRYLKATDGWYNCGKGSSYSYQCEDTYGFSALPGGDGSSDGSFGDVGYFGSWWSASEYDSDNAYYRYMLYYDERANWYRSSKGRLFSVRCLQD